MFSLATPALVIAIDIKDLCFTWVSSFTTNLKQLENINSPETRY